jgi:hypothetical protein
MGLSAAYHLVMGAAAAFSTRLARAAVGALYGAALPVGAPAGGDDPDPLVYVIRMLGLLALAMGFLMACAALEPARHRDVILATIGLYTGRAAFRWWHAPLLERAMGVPRWRNALNVGLLVALVAALLWLLPPAGLMSSG